MMEPTNGKTARNHVLPGAMREQRGCGGYVGFDEILLSPDRLSRVLYNNDIVVNHLNTYQQGTQHRTSDADSNRGKILRVLPAADQKNILKSLTTITQTQLPILNRIQSEGWVLF